MSFDLLLQAITSFTAELFLPVLISFIACISFGIIFNIRGRNLLFSALGGAFSWM